MYTVLIYAMVIAATITFLLPSTPVSMDYEEAMNAEFEVLA